MCDIVLFVVYHYRMNSFSITIIKLAYTRSVNIINCILFQLLSETAIID